MIQRLHSELEAADVNHRRLQEAHIKMMDLIIGSLYYCKFILSFTIIINNLLLILLLIII